MIKKIGLLIPIHPPKYSYLKNIFESYDDGYDYEIIFIFSNINDKNLACKIYPKINEYKSLILNQVYNIDLRLRNVVFAKKYLALNYFKDSEYDYFIILDSEIKFIHHQNLKSILDEIYDNKIIYGSVSEGISNIMTISKNLFSIEDQKILNTLMIKDLYTWWSDLPFIKREDISDFFKKINLNITQEFFVNIRWEHFDHIVYQYYLILYKNFKINRLKDKNLGIENYDSQDFFESNRNPYICAMKYYNDNKIFKKILYIYHCDRY
jgi:hypothetical protein